VIRFPVPGAWTPGRVNPGLLAIQLCFLLQAAFRGLDYIGGVHAGDPIQRAVEGAAPYPVWGGLFYGLALLVLLGVAARRPGLMILGHLAFSALYLGIGLLVLSATAGPTALGAAGLTTCAAGTWALLSTRVTATRARVGLALPLMVIGQLAVVASLGSEYRTGTGLALSGIVHAALAAAVSWCSARQAAEDAAEVIPRA
jgi:hypothetical protein